LCEGHTFSEEDKNLFLEKIYIKNLLILVSDSDDDDSTPIPPTNPDSQLSEDSFENFRLQKAG
jgi:hypothetical protein